MCHSLRFNYPPFMGFSLAFKIIMSIEQSGRLGQFIAKELRKKHLSQDIRFTQIRNKNRHNKLTDTYSIPEHNQDSIYLYSNYHGNQFILRESTFDDLIIDYKEESVQLVKSIHKELNQQIYKLWAKKRTFSKTLYFPSNKKVIVMSIIAVLMLFLIGCSSQPLAGTFNMRQQFKTIKSSFNKLILWIIVLLMLICFGFLVGTLREEYSPFNYEKDLLRLVISTLKAYEERIEKFNMKIECDEQITWIRFQKRYPEDRKLLIPNLSSAESHMMSFSGGSNCSN